MPEFPGRLRTPRLASAPSSPAEGEMYYDTAGKILYWRNNAVWVSAGAIPRVTSLPGSPVDGQEIYYAADSTGGVLWHLRYNGGSASAYKWEFLGGSPSYGEQPNFATPDTISNVAFSVPPTNAGPNITVPLAGDYHVTIAGQIAGAGIQSYQVGATAASDDDGVIMAIAGTNHDAQVSRRKDGLTAGLVLATRIRVFSGSVSFLRRRMTVVPVRVG